MEAAMGAGEDPAALADGCGHGSSRCSQTWGEVVLSHVQLSRDATCHKRFAHGTPGKRSPTPGSACSSSCATCPKLTAWSQVCCTRSRLCRGCCWCGTLSFDFLRHEVPVVLSIGGLAQTVVLSRSLSLSLPPSLSLVPVSICNLSIH